MTSSTITTKGQITIPKKIRDRFNLQAGDSIDFEIGPDNRIVMIPSKYKPGVVYGILYRKGQESFTVEEMESGVADYFKEKYKQE